MSPISKLADFRNSVVARANDLTDWPNRSPPVSSGLESKYVVKPKNEFCQNPCWAGSMFGIGSQARSEGERLLVSPGRAHLVDS